MKFMHIGVANQVIRAKNMDSLDYYYYIYMQPQGVGVLSQNNLLASTNQVIKIKSCIQIIA